MAYQHFYSRVPARLSMFERADSFDTFAKSEQFDEKFINSNFIPFCNIKLSQNELNQIRDGKFTTAYAQYFSKNGENLIHSAISYIPLDFTGERSSYMVHSLLYNEEGQGDSDTHKRSDQMMVTPREIDTYVSDSAKLIAYGLNFALHQDLTLEDVDLFIS